MSEIVTTDIHQHVATVTLNRPDKYNALNRDMFDAISAAGSALAASKDVRAVVLTGAGGNFCAGIDISGFGQAEDPAHSFAKEAFVTIGGSPANRFQHPAWVWHAMPVPVIAAIDGVCFGGGAQIAAGADIRIATPASRLSIMEIKWGLVPDMGFTAVMRHVMRLDHLKELAFSGRIIDAAEARDYGLVSTVVEDALGAAQTLAAEIAARSPDAIRGTKHLLNHALNVDAPAGLALEAKTQLAVMGGRNQVEAVMANVQKRAPEFVASTYDPEAADSP